MRSWKIILRDNFFSRDLGEDSWRDLREDNFLVKVLKIHLERNICLCYLLTFGKRGLSWSTTVGRFSWKEVFFFCHWYSPRRIVFLGILNSWRILLKQCCFEWMILNAERRKQYFNLFKKNTSSKKRERLK